MITETEGAVMWTQPSVITTNPRSWPWSRKSRHGFPRPRFPWSGRWRRNFRDHHGPLVLDYGIPGPDHGVGDAALL